VNRARLGFPGWFQTAPVADEIEVGVDVMRKFLLAMAAFVVALAASAVPSGAGLSMYDFSISPTTGPAGTEATFASETPCPVSTILNGATTSAVGDTTAAISLEPAPGPGDFLADTLTDGSGTWSIDYTIPGATPPGDLTFYAFCLLETSSPVGGIPVSATTTATYRPQVFTVTAPATTTTTSTSTSTTSTSTSTTSTTAAPNKPALVATPTTVFPGDPIAVNATGFKPGSNVVITLESDPVNLGSYVADSAGKIATNVVVPADFPAGAHTLKLTGTDIAGAVLVLSTGVTVASRIQPAPTTAAPTTVAAATTGTLPTTGSSFTEPALAGAAVLVLGGSIVLLAARRRRASLR
jgi:LPXTG-motif cell wall-anchored protein